MNENKVALMVHSCDRYEFLFKGFEITFNEYWPDEINTNLYFATEIINPQIENFNVINSGKGEWSDRLRYLLEEKIREDYILYMQEDMWISKKVDINSLNGLINYVMQEKLNCVKLHSSEVYKEGIAY